MVPGLGVMRLGSEDRRVMSAWQRAQAERVSLSLARFRGFVAQNAVPWAWTWRRLVSV